MIGKVLRTLGCEILVTGFRYFAPPVGRKMYAKYLFEFPTS